MWLARINNSEQQTQAHLQSILNISQLMEDGFKSCLKVTNGKPLLQLLTKYSNILNDYARLLYKLKVLYLLLILKE